MNVKQKVLRQIQDLKTNAESVAQKNLDRALSDNEFKQAYLKIKSLNYDIAKLEFFNKPSNQKRLALKKVQSFASLILKRLGLSFDDFKPKYNCKYCSDTGFVNGKYCKCYYDKLNTIILNNINVDIDKTHTFKNCDFSIFDNPEKIKNDYKKIQNWVEDIENSKYKNLLISGQTGVGKTYLVECICNTLLQKGKSISFFTAFALNNMFLKYHTTFDDNKGAILDSIIDCDFLIVDDLGSEPIFKKVNEDYLYLVLNERLLKHKTTIVTTNLTLRGILDRYGDRTFSRICNKANTITINIENDDLRLRRNKN